jgi:hypothetical protein
MSGKIYFFGPFFECPEKIFSTHGGLWLKSIPDFSIFLTMAVCGYKGYQISVYLLATAPEFTIPSVSHGDVWL